MNKPELLVGFGQDSHTFVDDINEKKLFLGGIELDHKGLKGNSDGDVILHAIFNAIAQCIGAKSLGHYSDPMCLEKGITDSKEYLKVILKMMDKHGYEINNLSISLECREPKIDKISDEIKSSLKNLLRIPLHLIGLTATTGENLTSFGQNLGIQCFVNISLRRKPIPFYKKPTFIITILVVLAYLYGFYYAFNKLAL